MHALIINGSPRVKKYSNTDKILEKILLGMKESGSTGELYEISDRKQWEEIREKFYHFDHILIALPLFVECIPGLLLEFLETIPARSTDRKPVLSFLLQSGFAEGCQLRCGEEYLQILSGKLGCEYGGTLVKDWWKEAIAKRSCCLIRKWARSMEKKETSFQWTVRNLQARNSSRGGSVSL